MDQIKTQKIRYPANKIRYDVLRQIYNRVVIDLINDQIFDPVYDKTNSEVWNIIQAIGSPVIEDID